MRNRRNYYRVLHVQPDAPAEIIRTSYRTLMQRLRMHPDLGGDQWNAALINEAFEVLADPGRRAAYDASLRKRTGSLWATAGPGQAPGRDEETRLALAGPATLACPFCATIHAARDATVRSSSCASCGSPLYPAARLQPTNSTRRVLDRVPTHLPIEFCVSWPATRAFTGVTEDVSILGMRFVTSLELVVDERVRVDCEFCSAVGAVRRAHRREDATWEVGLAFLTLRIKRTRGGLVSMDV